MNKGDFISEDNKVVYSNGNNKQNGVSIMLNKTWVNCVRCDINYRLIISKLKSVPNKIVKIKVYMHTTQASLIIEEMIEGIQSRTRYISQIMKDVGVNSLKQLNDMVNNGETRKLLQTNF